MAVGEEVIKHTQNVLHVSMSARRGSFIQLVSSGLYEWQRPCCPARPPYLLDECCLAVHAEPTLPQLGLHRLPGSTLCIDRPGGRRRCSCRRRGHCLIVNTAPPSSRGTLEELLGGGGEGPAGGGARD